MPTFHHNGVAVHYGDGRDGAPRLLLLHSGGSSGAQWKKTSNLLSGRRLLTPDFYGHGGTDAWPGKKTLQHDDQADLVTAVIANAGLVSKQVDIVAHSYGGAGAVRMVLRNLARIRSLVLIEPMLAMLLREAGEQELFDEYETLAHGFLERVAKGQEVGTHCLRGHRRDFANRPMLPIKRSNQISPILLHSSTYNLFPYRSP